MEKLKVAIVDMGTNTFHLMIVEYNVRKATTLHRERVAVKIGMGGTQQGIITQDGIARATVAMKAFKQTIDRIGATKVMAFGTSALRSASNGDEVGRQLEQASGIPVTIISGEEEAMYIYKGVKSAVKMTTQSSLIVDIGGGSVEFIIGDDTGIFWKHSFDIGAQRLLERFQEHDPISQSEIKLLDEYLDEALNPLLEMMAKFQPQALVGSSGTFDTLSEIYCLNNNIHYDENDPETPLTAESFYQTFNQLKTKDRAQRLQMPGMIEMRVDMIVVACCLIDFLLRHHPFEIIRVSTYSLKEGVLESLK